MDAVLRPDFFLIEDSMIGLVIVTHGQIGAELIKVSDLMIGTSRNCRFVPIEMNINPDYLSDMIGKAIQETDRGRGVLIMTDMFGGTPSNIALSFLEAGKVEVLTGVNLPILFRALTLRENEPTLTLEGLAAGVTEYGRRSITIASDMIKKKS
jgi:PTS system mannose-specific IIA component